MTALIARDRVDGSKPDTPNGVNVANLLLGLGNLHDAIQTVGVGVASIAASAVLTQANAGLLLIDATAGNIAITLPACSAAVGAFYQFKRIDATANTVTVNRAGGDTIDSALSFALSGQHDFQEIRSDGVGTWRLLNISLNPARARAVVGAAASGANVDITSLAGPVSTINAVPILHLNDIINGDFRIAQAGTSFAAAVNGAYDFDGWLNTKVGLAVFTIDQIAGSTAGRLARRVTITTIDDATAAGDLVADTTRIEGFNAEKYVGKTFTVAFRARVPVAGIHCVSLRSVDGVLADMRSYVKEINFPTANAWQDCSFTVVGGLPTTGVWNYTNGVGLQVSLAHQAGTDFHTTADAWNAGSRYSTANQVNDCATLNNVWALEKVTMNLGTVAAVSEIDVGDELRRCMRYREPINLSGDIAISRQTGTQATSCPIPFAVPKRAAPTFSAFNTATTLISIAGAGVVAGTTTTANNITTTSFTALMTFGAFTATAGYAVALGGTTAMASATL